MKVQTIISKPYVNHQNYPEKGLNALKSRNLYHLLIPLEWLKPKALEKNANIEAQSCKNLKNLKINPKKKQHMFNQLHNILETRERMARCKQTTKFTCPHCQEVENTTHIFKCRPRTSAQAIQWLYKEIGKTCEKPNEIILEKAIVVNFNQTQNTIQNKLTTFFSNFSWAL